MKATWISMVSRLPQKATCDYLLRLSGRSFTYALSACSAEKRALRGTRLEGNKSNVDMLQMSDSSPENRNFAIITNILFIKVRVRWLGSEPEVGLVEAATHFYTLFLFLILACVSGNIDFWERR